MAQIASYPADLSLPVEVDPHVQMGDGPLEVDSSLGEVSEHGSDPESDTEVSTLVSHTPFSQLFLAELSESLNQSSRY